MFKGHNKAETEMIEQLKELLRYYHHQAPKENGICWDTLDHMMNRLLFLANCAGIDELEKAYTNE